MNIGQFSVAAIGTLFISAGAWLEFGMPYALMVVGVAVLVDVGYEVNRRQTYEDQNRRQ